MQFKAKHTTSSPGSQMLCFFRASLWSRDMEKTEIVNMIKERKLRYLGHIMRNTKYQLLKLILQGKIEGRRGSGRRRILT